MCAKDGALQIPFQASSIIPMTVGFSYTVPQNKKYTFKTEQRTGNNAHDMKNEAHILWQITGTTIDSFAQPTNLGVICNSSLLIHVLNLTNVHTSMRSPVTNLHLLTISQVHEEYPQLFRIMFSLFSSAYKTLWWGPCLPAPLISHHSPTSDSAIQLHLILYCS